MSSMLKNLNDPELVASFQRLCGIVHRKKHSERATPPSQWEDAGDTNPMQRCTTTNGCDAEEFTTVVPNLRKRQHNNNLSSFVGSESFDKVPVNGDACKESNGDDNINSNDTANSSSDEEVETFKEYEATNRVLHYMFEFGASLGNEMFYITFFPFWFWNIDGYVGRRVLMFWCIFMYLGQMTKDIVRWPRPSSPPVFRLEDRYALEYGMPSTHAMVGAGLPVSLLILTYERYEYPFWIGLLICVTWCSLVCGSRIYLGMHTVLDVLVGLVFVFVLMLICFPFLDTMDNFILTNPYSPIPLLLIPLFLALCYPTLDKWSTARGDTTLILAVTSGNCLGHHICYTYGLMEHSTTPPPYQIIYPTWPWLGQMMMRLAIGVTILIATRTILKLLSYNLVCYLAGVSKEDQRSHQKLCVELPYKLITYTTIAIQSVWLVPQVFRYLEIERPTFFTEL